MSVKLTLGNKCCHPKEVGSYSFCLKNLSRKGDGDIGTRDTKLYLDLEEYQKSCANLPVDSVLTVPINFGAVPVDSKIFFDISLTHHKADKVPRHLHLEYDQSVEKKFDDVFRITFGKERKTCETTIEKKNATYIRGKTEREAAFRVHFHPELPSMLYNDSFTMFADHNPMRFQCRGFSEGPSLCFSQNILNFGGVVVGKEYKRSLEISNLSCCMAYFQFDLDNNRSLFKVCPNSGNLAPKKTMILEITFKPQKPQCYYKRIHCLVHHQSSQFLDVVGLAIPNSKEFVNKEISYDVSVADSKFIPLPSVSSEEYFKRDIWGIKLQQESFDFGFHDIYSGEVSSRKLTLSSSLPYDVCIEWAEDTSEIFQIFPQEQILPGSGKVDFQVVFAPKFPDSFFSGQLECYMYPVGSNWPVGSGPPWVCGASKIKTHKKVTLNIDVLQIQEEIKPQVKAPTLNKKKTKAKVGNTKSVPVTPVAPVTPVSKITTATSSVPEGAPRKKTKSDKMNYVPLEIRLQQYGNPKGKLINLKPKKSHFPKDVDALKDNKHVKMASGDGIDMNIAPKSVVEKPVVHEPFEIESSREKNNEKSELSTTERKTSLRVLEECIPSKAYHSKLSGSTGRSSKDAEVPPVIAKAPKKKKGKKATLVLEEMEVLLPKIDTPESLQNYNLAVLKTQEPKSIPLPQAVIEIALPLSRSIHITGHTYGTTYPPHISSVDVPKRLEMGPTLPQKRVSSTAIIRNKSDLPALFDIKYLDKKCGYRMKPKSGVIPGGQSQILLTNLTPRLLNTSQYITKSVVNVNLHDNFQMELCGMAQVPHLTILLCYDSLTKHRGILCPMTLPGCSTDTFIELINYSRFHYRFTLEAKHLDREDWQIFQPIPNKGHLTPNERTRIQWKFMPMKCKTYKVRWRFHFSVVKSGNDLTLAKGSDYELKMNLTGVSQHSTIQASVNTLDFDMVQIFDKETKTFTIKNMKNYIARARLVVFHEQWLKNFPKGMVTIFPTKINLAANESVTVSVTVRPTRVDIQKFYIEYQLDLTEKDEYGDILFEAAPVRLVNISFMGDHAQYKITDIMMISRHPLWDTEHCWYMFSLTKLNDMLASPHSIAREDTLPEVKSVTFRFPPAPVNSEPAIVTLMVSNIGNCQNRNALTHWEIITEHAHETGVHPNVSIPYAELHKAKTQKPPTFLAVEMRDSAEFLNALWRTKKISNGEMPSKIKTPPKFGYLKDKANRYSIDTTPPLPPVKPLFSIFPTHGSIQNKSSQQVTLKFSYNETGTHKMIVLLRVYPAIFVWIELFGRTLEPQQAYIQYMYRESMKLHPVSLSDMDPPIQLFWVYNGGNVPCTYEIDQKTFDEWKENNYTHAVMACLNPCGTVPAKSWYPIKLRFSPLEYSKYSVPMKISSENHEETIVILDGRVSLNSAMHLRMSRACDSSMSKTRKYNIINPLVPVSICPTFVCIQHFIPTGEKCTSIVFVTNLSSKHKMSFCWPEYPIAGGGSITFHPQSKLMEPNEEVTCMMQVKAGKVSTTFSCMIRCAIEDETTNAQYEQDMEAYLNAQKQWRNNKQNTYSKKPGPLAEKIPVKPKKPENFSRVLAVSLYIGTAFGMLDKLPPEELSKLPYSDPICQHSVDMMSALPFTMFLSQEVITQMLWETIHAPTFQGFARRVSRRQPPFFYEYKDAEEIDPNNEDTEESLLATQTTEEILEYTIFNMLQEMTINYTQLKGQNKWYQLAKPDEINEEFLLAQEGNLSPCFPTPPSN